MAYEVPEIPVGGNPIRSAQFGVKVRNSLIDHETRVLALEAVSRGLLFCEIGLRRTTTLTSGSDADLTYFEEVDPDNICASGTITIPTGMGGYYIALYDVSVLSASSPGSGRVEIDIDPIAIGIDIDYLFSTNFWGTHGKPVIGHSHPISLADRGTITPTVNIYNGLNVSISSVYAYIYLIRLG